MNESRFYAADWLGVVWSNWGLSIPAATTYPSFSTDEGLYRVRHPARPGLEYIGETGRSLRGRVRALAHGAFAEEMPYRDPPLRENTFRLVNRKPSDAANRSFSRPPLRHRRA